MDYIIKDISRTIVFEKFTEPKVGYGSKPNSLVALLNKAVDDGEFDYQNVDLSSITVHSFDEFREKFTPVIYQVYKENENGGYYEYITDGENIPDAKPAQLDTLALYDAAMEMYKNKGIDGKDNWTFDYSCFSRLINPMKIAKDNKRKRAELSTSMMEYIEAKNNNNSALAEKCIKKVLSIHDDIKKSYTLNPVAGLCLNLADLSHQLGYDENKTNNTNDDQKLPCATMFRLSYNDEGDLVKEKIDILDFNKNAPTQTNLLLETSNKLNRYLLETSIKGNSEKGEVGFVTEGKYMQDLVLNTYTQETPVLDLSNAEIRQKYEHRYQIAKELYSASQDSLLKAINSMIEKMLDIKSLFDNAGRDFEVIIANNTVSELLQVEDKFKDLIDNMNNDNDSFINFAILPQIFDKRFVKIKQYEHKYIDKDRVNEVGLENENKFVDAEYTDYNSDPLENLKRQFLEDKNRMENASNKANVDLCTLVEAKRIIEIMQKNKCITFFGYKACEETGFTKLNLKKIKQYKEEMKSFIGDSGNYSVFVYPNFTLMSGLQAGNIEVTNGEYIENPGFFIDASYVAVGLVIRSLNTKFLGSKELGNNRYKIDLDSLPQPCVRFDFEDSTDNYKNRNVVISNMNCESLKKFDKKVLDELDDEPFGFMFDTVAYYDNKKVKNTFVKYARNFGENDNRIFATLVKDFMIRDAKENDPVLTVDKLNAYLSSKDWLHRKDDGFVNNPFYKDDYFVCEAIDGKANVRITFAGNEKGTPINDIVVEA